MTTTTLKDVYHAFMDTANNSANMLEVEVNGSHVELDWIMCEVVTRFLEIPGIKEAILVAALKQDQIGYVSVRNGEERIGDIPFQFVWNYLINPAEIGLNQKENQNG